MNAEISLLLPDNTPVQEPKLFPENLAPEQWLRLEGDLKKTYQRKQVRIIVKIRNLAMELLRQCVPKKRVSELTGIQEDVLKALMAQEWKRVSQQPTELIGALLETGAAFAAHAASQVDTASFKDSANAATGFIARANDLALMQSIGSSNQAEDQAIPIDSTQSSPRDRVLALLKA